MIQKFYLLRLIPAVMGIFLGTGMLVSQNAPVFDLTNHWNQEENFPLSSMAASITYVPLETRKECFLPSAGACRIRLTNDYILVLPSGQPAVVFDRRGKFLWKIGKIGAGPKEVPEMTNVIINESKGWLAVKPDGSDRVVVYSLKGQFIREFSIDKQIPRIFSGPDGGITGLKIDLVSGEKGGQSLEFYSDEGKWMRSIPLFDPLVKLSEVYRDYRRIVIGWNKDLPLVIEFPFTEGYRLTPTGEWAIDWHIDGSSLENQLLSVSLSAGYLWMEGANPGQNFFVASTATGDISACSFRVKYPGPDICGVYNDLDGGMPFCPRSPIWNNQMAAIYDATQVLSYASGEAATYGGKAPEIKQSFKDMAAKLSIEDNPVVAVVRMK